MQYMALPLEQREALLETLEQMPQYLEQQFRSLTAEMMCQRGADGTFSPVEQVWHLADLEREGFGLRIDRLLSESEPQLPDFDGAAIAATRRYRSLSLTAGLAAFREARQRNLARLRTIAADAWTRSGQQQGVGRVSLCDMPGFMSQHDAAHRGEISAWKAQPGR
jgi:DinB superfamily